MLKEHSTSEVLQLKEVRKNRQLDWLFLDLDGTMIDTHITFRHLMAEMAEFISKESILKPAKVEVVSTMDRNLAMLRNTFKVDPTLMIETTRLTLKEYGLSIFSEKSSKALGKLMKLYDSVPLPFPGSVEAVEAFREAGFNIAVFTHSGLKWAIKKVLENGFRVHKILTVPTYLDKNAQQLTTAIDIVKTTPPKILYIGDSWEADVKTALEAGIPKENILRVATTYSHSNIGKVEGIREIDSFSKASKTLVEF